MANPVAVVTDSTAHIPRELTDTLPVFTIPLHLNWGGISYRDNVDITPSEFYQRLQSDSETPRTSQVTPEEFHILYSDLVGRGYDILSIHITQKYTKVFDAANLAASQFPQGRIQVIDSGSSAMAMGFQVLEAARSAKAGSLLHHCLQVAEQARQRTRVFFIPATLEFLRRGGRISDMTALIGTLLHIKPILTVRNGSLVVINRVRTMRHALAQLADSVIQHIPHGSAIRFAFMHSNFPARAQELMDRTLAAFKDGEVKETLITDISPALGTHIGPEAVGLAYILEN